MKAAVALEKNPESIPHTRTSVLRFPEGLIGFSECKNFVLIEEEDLAPFRRLQCTDRADVGFFVLNPECVRRNFLSLVTEKDWESVDLKDFDSRMVLVICRLGPTLAQFRANFLAPLIVNDTSGTGRQVVLGDAFLSYRHPLFRSFHRNIS